MGTRTSPFGVSRREGHDSSSFYSRKLYRQEKGDRQERVVNPCPGEYVDRVFCRDARDLSFLPDNCLHLMVTSPPYNVGKEYDENLSLDQYLDLLRQVMSGIYRVLVPGGRACINVANLGRKPYIPLNSHISSMMEDIGFLMRGEIIWNKSASSGVSTAWGSWCRPSNPTIRDVHEYILVFCKDSYVRSGRKEDCTITRDEFLEYTRSIWTFGAESARRVKHPAPFPVELPYRLIQLYTYRGDVVIDPFVGSGTTCVAALKSGRRYIGIDINEEYVSISRKRAGELP